VITPGTHTPENPKENIYIMSIYPAGRKHGIAAADISTGQFIVFETEEEHRGRGEQVRAEGDCTAGEPQGEPPLYRGPVRPFLTFQDDWSFDYADAYRVLTSHFR